MKHWFDNGLSFTSLPGCAACCLEPGRVMLDSKDIALLARGAGCTVKEFRRSSVVLYQGHAVLKLSDSGICPYVRDVGCIMYEYRPTQCRTFPFWPEHALTEEGWEVARQRCPGVGIGEVVAANEIEECLHNVSITRQKCRGYSERDMRMGAFVQGNAKEKKHG